MDSTNYNACDSTGVTAGVCILLHLADQQPPRLGILQAKDPDVHSHDRHHQYHTVSQYEMHTIYRLARWATI